MSLFYQKIFCAIALAPVLTQMSSSQPAGQDIGTVALESGRTLLIRTRALSDEELRAFFPKALVEQAPSDAWLETVSLVTGPGSALQVASRLHVYRDSLDKHSDFRLLGHAEDVQNVVIAFGSERRIYLWCVNFEADGFSEVTRIDGWERATLSSPVGPAQVKVTLAKSTGRWIVTIKDLRIQGAEAAVFQQRQGEWKFSYVAMGGAATQPTR